MSLGPVTLHYVAPIEIVKC